MKKKILFMKKERKTNTEEKKVVKNTNKSSFQHSLLVNSFFN